VTRDKPWRGARPATATTAVGSRKAASGELAPADQAALEDVALATALMTTMGEAFRQGVGG
jgi:hypothetical protein